MNVVSLSRPRLVITARDTTRDAPSSKTSTAPSFQPPQRLVSNNNNPSSSSSNQPQTQYSIRLTTSPRGTLTDPNAGIWLSLIGAEGAATLQYLDPLDCSKNTDSTADDKKCRRRFQGGDVDVLTIQAPDIGPLTAVLIAPEAGTWGCEELVVSSSSSSTDGLGGGSATQEQQQQPAVKFVCRESLGERGSHPAAYLTAIPIDSVLYGTGTTAQILTKDEAAIVRNTNNQWYGYLKKKALTLTAFLGFAGSCIALVSGGPELAGPFALGSGLSLAYQAVLQKRVDDIVPSSSSPSPNTTDNTTTTATTTESVPSTPTTTSSRSSIMGAAGIPALVAFLLTAGLLSQISMNNNDGGGGGLATTVDAVKLQQVAAVLSGFFVGKLALIGVSLTDEGSSNDRSSSE